MESYNIETYTAGVYGAYVEDVPLASFYWKGALLN